MTSITQIVTELDHFSKSLYGSLGGFKVAKDHWLSLAAQGFQLQPDATVKTVKSPFGRRGYLAIAWYALQMEDIGLFIATCLAGAEWETEWLKD